MSGLVEFLLARVGEDEANPDCEGSGEYLSCEQWSERHERECEAKREIIAEEMDRIGPRSGFVSPEMADRIRSRADSRGLRALASVYADHPDYREEWR